MDRSRIIITGAESTNNLFRMLLESCTEGRFVCTECATGLEAKNVIGKGVRFDLVVMDVALTVEDDSFSLKDASRTGIRLIRMMLERGTSRRFYVCTSHASCSEEVQQLCSGRAALLFEHHLDNDPEDFIEKVNGLLKTPIPSKG